MSMTTRDFLGDDRVRAALKRIDITNREPISDVTDPEGHEYVDLVMEGGGVLGIALLGYTYALEHAGIRFRSIGGTSAGAINATLLAAAAAPHQPRSERVLGVLANLNMFSFIDGGDDARDFLKDYVLDPAGPIRRIRSAYRNLDEICETFGMNPGRVFRDWVAATLGAWDIETTAQLIARMNAFPAGLAFAGNPLTIGAPPGATTPEQARAFLNAAIKLVATEVTTTSKIVFPEMAGLFFFEPDGVSPAAFVRASMSVPYVFEPFRVYPLPNDQAARDAWARHAGYRGEIPREAVFLDGGLMSNFPISLFHSHTGGVPRLPTFGVKLGRSRIAPKRIGGPLALAGAMFSASRQASDLDFLWRNPDFQHLIAEIDLDRDRDGDDDVHWLNFHLTAQQKIHLFAAGVEAAETFLLGDRPPGTPGALPLPPGRSPAKAFDWASYKAIRAAIPLTDQQTRAAPPAQPQPGPQPRPRTTKKTPRGGG
jgi:NTE family protein